MISEINRSQNGFTFDTCIGIKMCENPNFGSLLACRLDIADSEIHLNAQAIFEAKKHGYNVEYVSKQIKNNLGVRIIYGSITDEIKDNALSLEESCPTLHHGDSQILAYAIATKTTLITCDKGLEEAARISSVQVVNPDLLTCTEVTKKTSQSKIHRIAKKAIAKPTQTKQKIQSFVLKPGEKILWRSFN